VIHDQDSDDLRDVLIKLGDLAAVEADERDSGVSGGEAVAAQGRSKTEPRSRKTSECKATAADRPRSREPELVAELRLTLRRQRYKVVGDGSDGGSVSHELRRPSGLEYADSAATR
jgi:hypothetical protein